MMPEGYIIQEQQGVTTVTLPSQRKNRGTLIFSLLFLPLWLYGSFSMAYISIILITAVFGFGPLANDKALVENPGFTIGVSLGLLVMILYGYFLILGEIYIGLWQRVGKEIVEIDDKRLRIWRQIGKWKHAQRPFFCDRVKNIGVYQAPKRLFSFTPYLLVINYGKIAFDYENKLVRFGLEVSEADAEQVISLLQKKMDARPLALGDRAHPSLDKSE